MVESLELDLSFFNDVSHFLEPSGIKENQIFKVEEDIMGDFYIGLNGNATMEIISRLNYKEEIMQQVSFSWQRKE